MAQIKLSIAFVLAAAVITPTIVAHPIHEDHEFASNMGHHLHHHHKHHHHHHGVAIPELEPTSDTTPPSPREYADEFGDMFEREEVGSGVPHFRGTVLLGHGPVVHRPFNGLGSHGMGFGHGPVVHRPFNGFGSLGMGFGHGPVVHRPFNGLGSHGMPVGFGHGPVVHRPFNGLASPALRSGPRRARQGFGAREYAESDMFERDLDDVEFDARDFVDELYLD